jgi:hypothetical protein
MIREKLGYMRDKLGFLQMRVSIHEAVLLLCFKMTQFGNNADICFSTAHWPVSLNILTLTSLHSYWGTFGRAAAAEPSAAACGHVEN